MAQDALRRLLRPRHIAVIGGREAEEVARQCERIGFPGEIWPVNPKRSTMAGRPAYASIAALPEAPDASFIGLPREVTVETVAELARRGAGGAVCYAAGFAELDPTGARLQQRLVDVAGDVAVVGPNCYGLLNYLDGAALWPDNHGGVRVSRGVAIVAQSGNMGINMTMQRRSVPIAYLISVGNQACLGLHQYVDALVDDGRVSAIGLHIEGLTDVGRFCRAALRALRQRIPIVALKTGSSELGGQAAMSHTSALTAPDAVVDALFERLGIARVRTLSEFLEALKFLSVIGPLPDSRIASISCSGGEAALVADLAERRGLSMPSLTADQRRELTDVLGSRVALSNPLDYHTYIWGQEEPLTRCFSAMTRGPQAATLAILDYPTQPGADTEGWDIAVRAFVAAVKAGRTAGVVVSTLPESLPENVRRMLTAEGIAPMQGLDECLAAVQAASAIGMRADHVDPGFAPLPAQAAGDRVDTLDEWQSKQALAEYGLNIPEGRLVTAADAPAAAAELGFPVAVKAVGKNIVHKTEIGAVALGVSSTGAAAGAVAKMRAMSEQFLVERMVDGVVAELIVGVTRQGPFGLVLVIGTGGTYTELLSDTVTLVLPVTRREIEAALGWLQVKAILDGYRRQPRGDVAALIRAIEAVAAYAVRHADEIHEIDVNPVLVLAEGGGAVAADALIRVYRPAVATPEVIVSSSEIVS